MVTAPVAGAMWRPAWTARVSIFITAQFSVCCRRAACHLAPRPPGLWIFTPSFLLVGVLGGWPGNCKTQAIWHTSLPIPVPRTNCACKPARSIASTRSRMRADLRSLRKSALILLRVDAIDRAGLQAQFVLGTGIGNDVCHIACVLQLPGQPPKTPTSRKEGVNIHSPVGLGARWHAARRQQTLHWAVMKIETRAVHAGRHIDPATGAVTMPIHLSTTFERSPAGEYPLGYSYSRENNPNRQALEVCLADLEGGTQALAFSSGLAVATALVQGLEPGDHILAPDDVYWGLRKVIGEVFGKFPIETTYIDMTDLDAVSAGIRPSTRLIWVETPSNPLMKITDLAAVAGLARAASPQV